MSVEIQSVGLPPERYADYIIAKMLREMITRHANVREAICNVIRNSSDGSPKAQRKLEQRILRAGADKTKLVPGKRGRYHIDIYDWTGWDPATDDEIAPGDFMPDKPQIAMWYSRLKSKGNGSDEVNVTGYPILFVTHHSLSRAAQRWGARTSEDMLAVLSLFWNGIMQDKRVHDFNIPPNGYRITTKDMTFVVKTHESKTAWVIATVLS